MQGHRNVLMQIWIIFILKRSMNVNNKFNTFAHLLDLRHICFITLKICEKYNCKIIKYKKKSFYFPTNPIIYPIKLCYKYILTGKSTVFCALNSSKSIKNVHLQNYVFLSISAAWQTCSISSLIESGPILYVIEQKWTNAILFDISDVNRNLTKRR